MNIHDLYAAKQREYQEFQVKQGVYEQRVSEALANVLAATEELAKTTDILAASDQALADRVAKVIADVKAHADQLDNPSYLSSVVAELQNIQALIEQQVEGALR